MSSRMSFPSNLCVGDRTLECCFDLGVSSHNLRSAIAIFTILKWRLAYIYEAVSVKYARLPLLKLQQGYGCPVRKIRR